MDLCLGILSWHGYQSLERSLESYSNCGNFLKLFNEKCIYFQEISSKYRDLASKYDFNSYGANTNLGIFAGFKALAENANSEYLLLLENDCPLIESYQNSQGQIAHAYHLLESGRADIIRMRSTKNPGEDFAISKFLKYHHSADNKLSVFIKNIRQLLRLQKTKRLIGLAPYAIANSHLVFPREIKALDNNFYLTCSKYLNWTNQSIMVRKNFFLNTILKRVEEVESKRTTNGFKNIEIELNNSWWRRQKYAIAIAPGLFTHQRLEYRGY